MFRPKSSQKPARNGPNGPGLVKKAKKRGARLPGVPGVTKKRNFGRFSGANLTFFPHPPGRTNFSGAEKMRKKKRSFLVWTFPPDFLSSLDIWSRESEKYFLAKIFEKKRRFYGGKQVRILRCAEKGPRTARGHFAFRSRH